MAMPVNVDSAIMYLIFIVVLPDALSDQRRIPSEAIKATILGGFAKYNTAFGKDHALSPDLLRHRRREQRRDHFGDPVLPGRGAIAESGAEARGVELAIERPLGGDGLLGHFDFRHLRRPPGEDRLPLHDFRREAVAADGAAAGEVKNTGNFRFAGELAGDREHRFGDVDGGGGTADLVADDAQFVALGGELQDVA